MPNSSLPIREDLFQKQHAEAMHALIWALSQYQLGHAPNDATLQKIQNIAHVHAEAFKQEPVLREQYEQLIKMEAVVDEEKNRNLDNDVYYGDLRENRNHEIETRSNKIKDIAKALSEHEKAYQADLNRKSTRHKLSLFFAFFMAVGCGTTLAGSNFLIGLEYGLISNIGFLTALGIISLPIIIVVSMANWWLAVRAVPDLENKNRDPYLITERFLGKNTFWKAPLFAISIFFIEIYNAITFNFKENAEQEQKEKNEQDNYFKDKHWNNSWEWWFYSRPMKLFWYLAIFLGAVIYAFFAFAATYDLGMGLFEFMVSNDLATTGAAGAASVTSSFFGILMAIPTYIAMKVIYYVSTESWMVPGKGPLNTIEKIPGWEKPVLMGMNLKQVFIFVSILIILSVGFMTYAAVDPLAAWFKLAGMGGGQGALSTVLIAVAFVGNIPFYVNTAARSFVQMFDPRVQLVSMNSQWFPYIRFWNAVLNALPAIVGVIAFFGLFGVTGPGALLIPIVLNVVIGAAASYFANSNGTPSMYKFDAAKQISLYQITQLEELAQGNEITVYEEMTPDNQLYMEYHGASLFFEKGVNMPPLSTSLNRLFTNEVDDQTDSERLYQAMNPNFKTQVKLIFDRGVSAFYHSNKYYTQHIFPHDYLIRIEHHGSPAVKKRLYDAALAGGGKKTAGYCQILEPDIIKPVTILSHPSQFIDGKDATIFWKAYSVRSAKEQSKILKKFDPSLMNNPQFQEKLMEHSLPETRQKIVNQVFKWRPNAAQSPYENFREKNALDSLPVIGFMAKNLLFPLILAWDGVKKLSQSILNSVGLGRLLARPFDRYHYYTVQAPDKVRRNYLVEVLSGFLKNHSLSKEEHGVVAKFQSVLNLEDKQITLTFEEIKVLRSGFLGCVFEVAITIPDVKARLQTIFNATAEEGGESEKNQEPNGSPVGSGPASTGAPKTFSNIYQKNQNRESSNLPAPLNTRNSQNPNTPKLPHK